MNILTNLTEHISDIVALLAALGVTVEVIPVKVSPLGWLGNRINKDVNDKIDTLQTEVNDKIDKIQKQVNDIEYKNAMKDLADVRNRLISYGILIQKGEKLEPNVISSIQHDLDMYDYYKETYTYMEINGRKVKINGEIETTRQLVNNMILGGKK